MRWFAHIVVELNEDGWVAWFNDRPHIKSNGEDLARAIAVLIDEHGSPSLQWRQIVAIEEKTWDGHAEFLVPQGRSRQFPPVPSTN